jgi:hypothetical protein
MEHVKIMLTSGKYVTFDCESFDTDVANQFLADHADDSTFAIHGFEDIVGEIAGSSYIANNGTSLILHRSDVVSIEVV